MLMKDKKQNMATLIVDRINSRGDEEKTELEQPTDATGAAVETEMDGPAVAADEVFAALEAKDKAGFIEAMKSMVQMCMDYEEAE